MLNLDAMHRKAMASVSRDGTVRDATIAVLLREVSERAPKLITITKVRSPGVIFFAALTEAGDDYLNNKVSTPPEEVPPKKGKKSPLAARQARHKRRLTLAGGKRVTMNFSPETNGFLIVIKKWRPRITNTEIVSEAIKDLAAKLHNASKEK